METPRWQKDAELLPAHAYVSADRRFSIIWDPEGWHLWNKWGLAGVFQRLKDAKAHACAFTASSTERS